ncbi:MAG: restriction endonuclease subunit S domain-containing protein [Candidatus Nanopelagicales bacterium]
MKTVLRERNVRNQPHEPLLAATQSMGVVRKETYGQRTVLVQTGFEQLKLVEPRDFVISLRSFQGGIEYARERGIISAAYTVLRTPDPEMQPYLGYLLKSRVCLDAIQNCVVGIREGQNVDWKRLGRELVPVPPAAYRAFIVRYLDNAELTIARAIQAKLALVQQIDELAAVRRWQELVGGADTAVRTVEGAEWLGAVPESFEPVRFKAMFTERTVRSGTGLQPLLSLRMREGLVRSSDFSIRPEEPEKLVNYKVVAPGQLVMNRMRASIGLFGVATTSGIVSPDYAVFDVAPGFDPEFLLMLLKSPQCGSVIRANSRGMGTGHSGFLRIYTDAFGRIQAALPSFEEQQRRRLAASEASSALAAASAALLREIALLREYRTRLISDVVTGKKDVRAQAAGMKDVDPAELAAVLGGATDSRNDDVEGDDDVE